MLKCVGPFPQGSAVRGIKMTKAKARKGTRNRLIASPFLHPVHPRCSLPPFPFLRWIPQSLPVTYSRSIDKQRVSSADGHGWRIVFLFEGRRRSRTHIAPPQLPGWCAIVSKEKISIPRINLFSHSEVVKYEPESQAYHKDFSLRVEQFPACVLFLQHRVVRPLGSVHSNLSVRTPPESPANYR